MTAHKGSQDGLPFFGSVILVPAKMCQTVSRIRTLLPAPHSPPRHSTSNTHEHTSYRTMPSLPRHPFSAFPPIATDDKDQRSLPGHVEDLFAAAADCKGDRHSIRHEGRAQGSVLRRSQARHVRHDACRSQVGPRGAEDFISSLPSPPTTSPTPS